MGKNSFINKYKVSVCVSVHNTAKYLPRCLDSLCRQTLKELEIVLVNNGSTDNSEAIMYEYASSHPDRSFVILSQEDRGLAQGRQTGINNAHGDFIAVLDADDYVNPSMYEKMYNSAIKNNCDIVEIQTIRDGEIISSPYEGKHSSRKILLDYLTKGNMPPMMWMRLYKRELFVKPVLPDFYINNEDIFALPCLLYVSKTIFFLKEQLHFYTSDNEQSFMNQLNTNSKLIEKRYNNALKTLYVFKHFEEYVGKEGIKEIESEYKCFVSSRLVSFLLTDYKVVSYQDKIEAITKYTSFINQKEIERFIKKNLKFSINRRGIVKLLGIKLTQKIL